MNISSIGKRTAVIATCTLLVVATGLLAGCVLGEPEAPIGEEPVSTPDPPEPVLPEAPPDDPSPVTAQGDLGEPVAAGSWEIFVAETEFTVRDRLVVDIEITNTSDESLRVTPGDFTLAVDDIALLPTEAEEHGLSAASEVSPGNTIGLTGLFDGVMVGEESSLMLVFAPAEGGPVRIEIAIAVP